MASTVSTATASRALNHAFVKARNGGNTYRTVLKEKSRIRISVLDVVEDDKNYDRDYFRLARLDDFISGGNAAQMQKLSQLAEVPRIRNLTDLMEACEKRLNNSFDRGAACLKCGMAYDRPLRFERVSFSAAEDAFNSMLKEENWIRWDQPISRGGRAAGFHDASCLQAGRARGLTMQVHTGLQEGNGNYIYHSDPALLSNLFLQYPDLKFDLFHIGYPYQQTLSALAKNFRNVFIDFAWATSSRQPRP